MPSTALMSRYRNLPQRQRVFVVTGALILAYLWILPFMADLNGEEGPSLFALIGRLHIVVLHLPIAWLALVPLLEYIALRRQSRNMATAAGLILLLAAVSAVIAATLGFFLAAADGYAGALVKNHMWFGLTTASAAVAALLLREFRKTHALPKYAYETMLVVALAAVTVAGHLGGTLTQGEGYLTARLPKAVKIALNIDTGEPIPLDYDSAIFASIVKPILEERCVTCHNDQKFKGEFSMASRESVLSGGKSGKPAVVPGEHGQSEMYRRITLARTEKKAMPPAEKDPLEQSEIELLTWWIDLEAPDGRSINDLTAAEYPPSIAIIVDDLIATAKRESTQFPSYDPEAIAREAALLKAGFGIDVQTVSRNPADGLAVQTLNITRPMDGQALQALLPIAEYVRELDLGNSVFENNGFAAIEGFTRLESLRLDHSVVPGEALAYLASLNLESLNLFGTQIDDKGVEHLSRLRSIRRLYLGQTGISAAAVESLRSALPRSDISAPDITTGKEPSLVSRDGSGN